jgi:hypothetical protein
MICKKVLIKYYIWILLLLSHNSLIISVKLYNNIQIILKQIQTNLLFIKWNIRERERERERERQRERETERERERDIVNRKIEHFFPILTRLIFITRS